MNTIPVTVWEQLGVVIIVFGFLLLVVKEAMKLLTAVKVIIMDINISFQKFIQDRDIQWQKYWKDQREADRMEEEVREKAFQERNGQVVMALENLSKQIESLTVLTNAHAQEMTLALDRMERKRN